MDIFEGRIDIFVENTEFHALNRMLNSIDIQILEHGHLKADNAWKFDDLSSPFNRLYFVIDGHATIENAENCIVMEAGHAYFTPLYETFSYKCDKHLEKFYIHFKIELIPGHDIFKGYKKCMSMPIAIEKINQLLKLANSRDLGSMVICKAIIMETIGQLIKHSSLSLEEQLSFSEKHYVVYDYIENHCVASLRVQDIADHLNISISNLSKSFKNDTGLTLKSYIEDKIISKAQEMLLVTNHTVKEISIALDFADEFHFSRFFKNRTGISPSKYRLRNNHFK